MTPWWWSSARPRQARPPPCGRPLSAWSVRLAGVRCGPLRGGRGRAQRVDVDADRLNRQVAHRVRLPRRPVVEASGLCVDGWIPVDPTTLETSVPGVYAVGDVTS